MAKEGRNFYNIFTELPETIFEIRSESDDKNDEDEEDLSVASESEIQRNSEIEINSQIERSTVENTEIAQSEFLENGDEVFTNQAINLHTLPPEPTLSDQRYCCLTYAPHLETRTIFVIVSGCFNTFEEAERFSMILHRRDPRWNRSVGETGRPLPIPLDRRLFMENPIMAGFDMPNVPFNIISENILSDEEENSALGTEHEGEQKGPGLGAGPEQKATEERVSTSRKDEQQQEKDDADDDSYMKCVTCIVRDRNALFLPCRHLTFCIDCAQTQAKISNLCPICRSTIKEVLNVFL